MNKIQPNQPTTDAPKKRQGFASMDPQRQREIASLGGRAAHEKGTAHEWSAQEARNAGSKGGRASVKQRQTAALLQPKP